ncbi:hypothetical protein AB6A40_010255 [Gnathostoma spinigerum]|uniref:Uncharacterized protein n=1 Tax=Gnathostoma spinigerum TaxID=75299 RepID=A0ABD6F0S7_9BILA
MCVVDSLLSLASTVVPSTVASDYSSVGMSAIYQIAVVVLLCIIEGSDGKTACVTPLSILKCQVTWMGHFRVRSIENVRGDPHGTVRYILQVIQPVKGVNKGELIERETPGTRHGGLSLRMGEEYVLSGIENKFDLCSQMLRDQEYIYRKMKEEQKQAFRKIDLDCSPVKPEEPAEPERRLSDRDLVLRLLELIERYGVEASRLRQQAMILPLP